MRAAGYTDVERGERGSTEEHLTVTQFKVQAEQQRLEAVTGQVAQAEQSLEDAKAATEKQKKKLEALQKETKAAKAIALTVQDIEAMGKKATFGNNITLTPDECDTLKRYATNGILFHAENERLKGKLNLLKSLHPFGSSDVKKRIKISRVEAKSPAFPGCTGNCIRKGSGFYQFHPRQRKGNTGTQSTCP